MDESTIRQILRHVAFDTRTAMQELAQKQGFAFDDSMSDAEVLNKLLTVTGVAEVLTDAGATSVIDKLNEIFESE